MLKLSEALAGWKPSEKSGVISPVALLDAGWKQIVGAQIAQHSRPARIAEGTLTITTRSSAWSHQLSFFSEHLLRAVEARLPGAGIERLRFRVGTIAPPRNDVWKRRRSTISRPAADRADSASSAEALARFRREVEGQRGARRRAGWQECAGCRAPVVLAGSLCATCAAARSERLTALTARLMFEAPWLGYAGTVTLVEGLQEKEYEHIRSQLLAHWWGALARARASKQLSADHRERSIASSYVLLHSRLAPERIIPATARSILGDELHELLYGEPSREGGAVKNQKRRT